MCHWVAAVELPLELIALVIHSQQEQALLFHLGELLKAHLVRGLAVAVAVAQDVFLACWPSGTLGEPPKLLVLRAVHRDGTKGLLRVLGGVHVDVSGGVVVVQHQAVVFCRSSALRPGTSGTRLLAIRELVYTTFDLAVAVGVVAAVCAHGVAHGECRMAIASIVIQEERLDSILLAVHDGILGECRHRSLEDLGRPCIASGLCGDLAIPHSLEDSIGHLVLGVERP
mmetsp:Transcript_5699/g.13488  ORF Transcript_5699/g.13488 Transcript_5699/m.13488 type:complete len:227 (-) Transcript_5699:2651-3331(-)